MGRAEESEPRPLAMQRTPQKPSLETRPSPSSTRACSVSYNYARGSFGDILSRDACRDLATNVESLEAAILSSRCGYGLLYVTAPHDDAL